ncbi:MAG: NUDIX hydrolase [Candidatus Micrarchaeota archaeon]
MEWKIIETTIEHENPWFTVSKETIKTEKGLQDWYLLNGKAAVTIFGVTLEGKVVLIDNYRHGIRQTILELPAGFIDEGETPEQAAVREMREETGFKVNKIQLVSELFFRPSHSKDKVSVFYAELGEQGKQELDENEEAEVVLVTPRELFDKVISGQITSSLQVSAILLIKEKKFT